MTTRPTEPFRQEHAQLLEHVEHVGQAARELPRLSPEERGAVIGRVLEFLHGTLLPHAQAEEAVLYPEWARLVGYDDAAAPMIHDHREIVARIEQLERVAPDDVDAAQQLLYALHALILSHFHKEEDIQLRAFDEQPQELVDEVLARLAAQAGEAHAHH